MNQTTLGAALLLISAIPAQVRPDRIGFIVRGQNGSAGILCQDFTCTPYPFSALRGEVLTLEVRGAFMSPFAIAIAGSASLCLQLPGLWNQLILDLGLVTLANGTLNIGDPILACPGGIGRVMVQVPTTLPVNTLFAVQAVGFIQTPPAGPPILSSAVVATVK